MGKWDPDTIRTLAFVGFFGAIALAALRAVLVLLRVLSETALPAIP